MFIALVFLDPQPEPRVVNTDHIAYVRPRSKTNSRLGLYDGTKILEHNVAGSFREVLSDLRISIGEMSQKALDALVKEYDR